MDIPIKISEKMNSVAGKDRIIEARTLRAPREFRSMLDIPLGEFVTVKTRAGDEISLYVAQAFDVDVERSAECGYVTQETYELITDPVTSNCDLELVTGITLGCDPEVIVLNSKSEYVKHSGRRSFLIAPARFLGLKTKWGPIGYDGLLLEFRPMPSTDEKVVVDNLYRLLEMTRQNNLSKCRSFHDPFLAGISAFSGPAAIGLNFNNKELVFTPSQNICAGFHLHYGIPQELLGYSKSFLASQIIKVMDYYVGIPSVIPEGANDGFRRTALGIAYGKPGMYRIDNRTLEYRVPGASLMKHPSLTKGLLALGAVVMEDVISRIKLETANYTDLSKVSSDEDIRRLYPNIPPMMSIFQAICSPNAESALSHLPTIIHDVRNMIGFDRRAESVNEFFDCLNSADIATKFSIDVEENWWRYRENGKEQPRSLDFLQSSV